MRISVRTKLFVAFGLAFAIMGTTALISLDNAARLAENAERLTQSHKLVAKLHAVVLALDAAEASQRVFVATGQARFLEPYDEAVRTALDSVASLERLTDGSSAHRVIIGVLEQQVHARLDELDAGIESRGPAIGASGGAASTVAGGDTMAAIRGTVAALQATQDALHDGLEAALSRTGRANATVVVAMGVAAALLFIVAYTLSRGISNGVSAVARAMRKIAEGDLSEEIRIRSSDEIGDMAVSYREMQAYLLEAAGAATQIGRGELDISATPRSPRDALGNARAAMVRNLKQHVHAAELMASGDLSAEVVPLSDRDVLGNAFAHMIAKLRWMIGTLEDTARERADALALAETSASGTPPLERGARAVRLHRLPRPPGAAPQDPIVRDAPPGHAGGRLRRRWQGLPGPDDERRRAHAGPHRGPPGVREGLLPGRGVPARGPESDRGGGDRGPGGRHRGGGGTGGDR